MQRITFILCLSLCTVFSYSQAISEKLENAFRSFESDTQLRNGIASLYVTDANSGKVVFEKNASIGLAPASTQKIITSATAYELLGKSFRYKTDFWYLGNTQKGALKKPLIISPSGDPTLGSWRWNDTKENAVIERLNNAITKAGIKNFLNVIVDNSKWNAESIPDGWIWQDIANYYGAGASGLNWRENQFDVVLASENTLGSPVSIVRTKPELYGYKLESQLKAAAKGTGDNAYIYFPLTGNNGVIRGTIPVEEKNFTISGAIPAPAYQLIATIRNSWKLQPVTSVKFNIKDNETQRTIVHSELSPPLDSIIYWFNRRSINLYGEALMKTFAYQKKGEGVTDEGVDVTKDLWKGNGLSPTELNMVDGSGLSPLNRVTTKAQVFILNFAKSQTWYSGFYHSLPEFNGMKMKSGTIRGVKGFCGYHQSKDGTTYIFSFLVNNYNGSASALVQKMYKVLDHLK